MTRADIKAELRRSACEDARPFAGVLTEAQFVIYAGYREGMELLDDDGLRVLILLVAEALT